MFKTQDYSRKAMLFNSCEVPKNTRREINGLNGDHSGPELVSPNHTKLIHRQKARELRGNLGTQNSNLLFNINVLDAGGGCSLERTCLHLISLINRENTGNISLYEAIMMKRLL